MSAKGLHSKFSWMTLGSVIQVSLSYQSCRCAKEKYKVSCKYRIGGIKDKATKQNTINYLFDPSLTL